jgi:hypothetical protein
MDSVGMSHFYRWRFSARVFIAAISAMILFAAASGGKAFAQEVRDTAVAGWIADLRANGADVTTSAVEVDRVTKAVVLRGVKIVFPHDPAAAGATLAIGRLDIQGAGTDPALVAAERLKAQDLSFGFGATRVTAKAVALDGVSVPKLALKPGDPSRPFQSLLLFFKDALRSRIAALSVESVAWIQGENGGSKGSIGQADAKNVADGRIAQLALTDITWADGGDTQTTRVGRVVFETLAPSTFVYVIGAGGNGDPNNWQALADKITIAAIDHRGKDQHMEIAQADVEGVRLRQFPFDPTPFFELAASNPGYFHEHPEETQKFTAALLETAKVDSIAIHTVSADDGSPTPLRRTAIGSIEIANLDPLSAERITLVDIQDQRGDAGLRLGRLNIGKLELAPVAATEGAPAPRRIPYVGSLSADNLNLVRAGLQVELQKLQVDAPDHIGLIPTRLSAKVEGLRIPSEQFPDPAGRATLSDLGIKTLAVDLDLNSNWDEGRQQFDLDPMILSAENLGRFELSGSLVNIPRVLFEHPERFGDIVPAGELKRLRLRYVDGGLVPKLMDRIATANKQTTAQLRGALTANMPTILGGIADSSIRNNLAFALVGFLNDPQSLDIMATMQDPVSLAKVQAAIREAPATVPSVLGLRATANQKR